MLCTTAEKQARLAELRRVLAYFADPPRSWTERADRVEEAVELAHGDDPRLAPAHDQEGRMGRLFASGQVIGRLISATAR